MMKKIDKQTLYNDLYEIYKELLTKRQKEYFEYSYFLDYSLQEIANILEVSRNAAFDQIKKVLEKLDDYESKLKIYEKRNKRNELIDKYLKTKDENILNEIKGLDE